MENTPVIGEVRVGRILRPRRYKFRYEDVNPMDRLIFVRRGAIAIRCAGEVIRAEAGECVYLCAGYESETEYLGEENEIRLFLFLRYAGAPDAPARRYPANEDATALIEEASRGEALPPYRRLSLLYGILHHLTEVGAAEGKHGIPYVIRYIETHLTEECKVADYAAMCYLSESHFRLRFREATGKSPIAYRNEIRLDRAEELVKAGYSHAEAAHAVGFSSVPFYCRLAARRKKAQCTKGTAQL
ncbi:MAG: helix-turn-helix transcriptional regulator [Ruminococcaceae bacterium]|nr:helix-turn-helix transcriptional regulator [Oscillospiraceae bacterium]